jgi:hypothetical protein
MPAHNSQVALDGTVRAEEDQSSFCLEFVNMNTSSLADKRRNQMLIRSTAMKNFRRRQQSQRTQAKAAKAASKIEDKEMNDKEDITGHNGQCEETRSEWNQYPQHLPSPAVDDWIPQTAFTEPWPKSQTSSSKHDDGTWDIEISQVESISSSNDFFALSSPLTLLGGGRIDPFRVYPAGYEGPHVNELIDYCEFRSFPEIYLYLPLYVTNADSRSSISHIFSMAGPTASWLRRGSQQDFLCLARKGHIEYPYYACNALWRHGPLGCPSKSANRAQQFRSAFSQGPDNEVAQREIEQSRHK